MVMGSGGQARNRPRDRVRVQVEPLRFQTPALARIGRPRHRAARLVGGRPMSDPTDPPDAASLHDRFLAILPAVERHGRVYFRHLKCAHRKEEALAEVRAIAWKWFVRLAQRGKDPTSFVSAALIA